MKLLWNARTARRRSLVATIALGGTALMAGGCSTASLYFHNQGYEDATTEAKKQVDELDVAGAFKTLNENATDLAKQEDAAIVASTVALRDERLTQLIDPIPGDGEALKGEAATASRRLRMFVSADVAVLADLPNQMNDALYRTGAETFRQYEKDASNNVPGAEAKRDKFLTDIQGASGAMSEAAANYSKAIGDKTRDAKEAQDVQKQIDIILKQMRGAEPVPDKVDPSKLLGQAIANLDKLSAAAQLAGLTEVENFLKCGLIVDLEGVAVDLDEDQAVKLQAKTLEDTKADAAAAAKASEADKEAAKSEVCPTETPQEKKEVAPSDDPQKKWNAAVATAIVVISELKKNELITNRLKRIDANIVALSNLRQRLGNAKAGVAYNAALLPLFKGYLYALLDQYRLLAEAAEANVALLDTPDLGFTTMRGTTNKRNAALALSSFASAWNYGKIPAVAIDFRFKQARRKYELEVAASSAANYKAVVQPLADALAQYGKGGITPDTVAQIIGQIGIFSALLK